MFIAKVEVLGSGLKWHIDEPDSTYTFDCVFCFLSELSSFLSVADAAIPISTVDINQINQVEL
jgi:hypothetical protein